MFLISRKNTEQLFSDVMIQNDTSIIYKNFIYSYDSLFHSICGGIKLQSGWRALGAQTQSAPL